MEYIADLGRRASIPAVDEHAAAASKLPMPRSTSTNTLMIENLISRPDGDPGAEDLWHHRSARFNDRCATFAVRIEGHTPLELATKLGERGFFTWDGNYYALNLTEHLDVEKSGGFLRIGSGALQHGGGSRPPAGHAARNCQKINPGAPGLSPSDESKPP